MGKIKGWERSEFGFREGVMWNTYISIKNRTIWIGKNKGKFVASIDNEKLNSFKTKEEATNYAMKYMRGHTNG